MKKNNKNFIIVFDPSSLDYLKSYIIKDIEHQVYDVKHDIKLKYLIASLFHLPKILINNFYLLGEVNLLKFLKIIKLYFICNAISLDISKLNPKAVLTYIDNSPIFHIVCKQCKDIPFLAIQNGNRELFALTEELIHPSHKYYIDEYFCFGKKTKDTFLEFKQENIGEYFFCGSLKEGIFFENNYDEIVSKEYIFDICLISEWQPDDHILYKTKSLKNHKKSLIKICLLLSEFIQEKKLSLVISCKSFNRKEENFYRKYFNNNVVFRYRENNGLDSYAVSCLSNVTISIFSTLAIEMIGARIKVLFVNPCGDRVGKLTNKKCDWYIHSPNYIEFSNSLNILLEKDRDKFYKENEEDIKYINPFDYKMPMHKMIRDRILNRMD